MGKSSILNSIWEKGILHDKSVSLPTKTCYLPQHLPKDLDFKTASLRDFPNYYELIYQWLNSEYSLIASHLEFDEMFLQWFLDTQGNLNPTFIKDFEKNIFELGLSTGFWDKNFNKLSAGTKKKIFLSLIFACDPDLIIVDELTNHLDHNSIGVVSRWVQESTATILLIDHNSEFLNATISNYLFLPNNSERKFLNYPNTTFDEFLDALDSKHETQAHQQKLLDKRQKSLEKQLTHLQ